MREHGPRSLGWLGAALVVAIALLGLFGALSLSADGGYYGMVGTGMGGWAIAMMAIPALVLVAVLGVALKGLAEPPTSAEDALLVLDGRYARGEITREEFMRIRADLAGQSSGP